MKAMAGSMKKVTDGWTKRNYHGIFRFYHMYDHHGTDEEWFNYEAKFTDGELESITRVEND